MLQNYSKLVKIQYSLYSHVKVYVEKHFPYCKSAVALPIVQSVYQLTMTASLYQPVFIYASQNTRCPGLGACGPQENL